MAAQPQLSYIDHYNLRQPIRSTDEQAFISQVAEIKHNLDKSKEYGIGTYLLFSRSFEVVINYDFTVNGLGDLTGVIHPMDSEHRKLQAMYAKALNEVLDYADSLGIKVIFHTNQFEFPDSLYKLAGDKLSGTGKVCPGKPLAFDLLKAKMQEFFAKYPKFAGIQLTLSETQAPVTNCNCPDCKNMSEKERFVKVADTAVEACKELNKIVMIRTWGRFEKSDIVDALPKSIICSTKFTLPDFHLTNYPNPVMGRNAEQQEVEFDGWGEYSGWNIFPCYYGDLFAQRMKSCLSKGVPRLAIRLDWEPGVRPIFSLPYGNEVNCAVFSNLANNPQANPDDLLRNYIAKIYPASAQDAAFKLYKRSAHLQTVWLTWRGWNMNDHSRVYTGGIPRLQKQIGEAIPTNYEAACKAIKERRQEIDSAYKEAQDLITALGPDVPEEWKSDMRRGARTHWFTAQANFDCIQMYADYLQHEAKRPMESFTSLEAGLKARDTLWRTTDPERYNMMVGVEAMKMLKQVKEKIDTK